MARRHAGVPARTQAAEAMEFVSLARAGALLTACANLVFVGRTSMTVHVAVTDERWNESDPPC